MRSIYIYLHILTVISFSLMPASPAQESSEHQAPAMAPAAPTSGFRAEFLKGIAYYEQRFTRLVEAMPAEKYTWLPARAFAR